jgi:hypothetical protein
MGSPLSAVVTDRERGSTLEQSRGDVVYAFFTVTWDDASRRLTSGGDRLAVGLLEHPLVDRLLVANPVRSLPIRLARRATGYRSEPFPSDDRRSLYQPFRLRRSDPRSIAGLERAFAAYDRRLQAAAERAGLNSPRVISTNPLLTGFAEFEWASGVTLYALDDWAAAEIFRPWRRGLEEAYARISAKGVAVGAVSSAIIDRIAPSGPAAVIPNGVDPGEWLEVGSPPAWFMDLPRPRILYIGVLDERLDLAALQSVAKRFPQGSIALVGNTGNRRHLEPLRSVRNVHLHTRVPRNEVVALVGAADVCLVPHHSTPLTQAMSPLKLYEYLAGGRPVAATALNPMRGVDDRVVLVEPGEDFATGVATALERGPAEDHTRRAFIHANSWHQRVDQLVGLALGRNEMAQAPVAVSSSDRDRAGSMLEGNGSDIGGGGCRVRSRGGAHLYQADVVFALASVTWDDARRRMIDPGDRLAVALLEHRLVGGVLVANPFRSLPIRLARRAVGYRSEPFPADERRSLYQPFRLRRSDPRSIRGLERSFAAYDRRLRAAAARAGLSSPRVILTNPLVAGFAEFEWASGVTLYALDDWAAAEIFRPWWAGLEEAYARISARGVRVAAVSEAIIERIAPRGPAAVIPNGVAPEEWLEVGPAPGWFAELPRPRMLYVGVVDERLDLRAVQAVAERFSSGSITLVGSVRSDVTPLYGVPNIGLRPRIADRREITALVSAADVCVVPHVSTALTRAMSPLKLYEYLAGGRPVAATALDPMRGIDERIVLVEPGDDFASGVATALERGPAEERARRAFIDANSWQTRFARVIELALS